MDKLFLAVSIFCFLGGFAYAVSGLRAGKLYDTRANLFVMAAGFVFLSIALSFRSQIHHRCPITSLYEVLIFLSWSMVLLYFILGRSFRLSLLGVFTAPLVLGFQLVALAGFFLADKPYTTDTSRGIDVWLELHASVSLVSFGSFALAGIAGLMFIVQNRQLKRHQLKTLFYNLPPIRYLTVAVFRLIGIGLILLTVGIISAFLMKEQPAPLHRSLSIIVWLVYASLLGLFAGKRIGNTKLAQGAVAAFSLPALTLLIL